MTFKCFTAVVLKRTDWIVGKCSGSTAAAVWCELTDGEAEAALAPADVLVAWWWLEDRLHAGQVVKTVAVCRSVGTSSLIVDSQRS